MQHNGRVKRVNSRTRDESPCKANCGLVKRSNGGPVKIELGELTMKLKTLNLCGAALSAAILTSTPISFAQAATPQPNYNPAVYASCVSLASNSYVRSQIGRRNIHYSVGAQKRKRELRAFCAAYQAQGIQVASNNSFVTDCQLAATRNASSLFRLRIGNVQAFQAVCSQMASTSHPNNYK